MNKFTGQTVVSRTLKLLTCGLLCFLCLIYGENVSASEGYDTVEAVIWFECDLAETSTYVIELAPDSSNAPLPDTGEMDVDESGKGKFTITLTEPGTYSYLLYQKKGSDKNIEYDDTVYEVHVFVINGSENSYSGKTSLSYSVSVNIAGTDDKPERIEFSNAVKGTSTSETSETETTTEITETSTETTEVSTETTEMTTSTEEITDSSESVTEQSSDVNSAKTTITDSKGANTADIVPAGLLIYICLISFICSLLIIAFRKNLPKG